MRMIRPSREETETIIRTGQYGVIPLSMELYSDSTTPIQVLKTLKKVSRHCYLLESAKADEKWGRYTFLGYQPQLEITCRDGRTTVKTSLTKQTRVEDPKDAIREILRENKSPAFPYLPSFTGGLVGYFSYDYVKYAEPKLQLNGTDEDGFQDVNLMLFDKVIVFDHFRQKMILIANMKTDGGITEYNRAVMELSNMASLIQHGEQAKIPPLHLKSDFLPLFREEEYCRMVEKAQDYIHEGDIFQVVLSNRLEAEFEGSILDVYRNLRTTNPSPYLFYFSGEDGEIAGASPETLARLEDGKLYTFPLAGTRKRGATQEEDEELVRELLSDEKELAEHNMLVDLGRNNIGRVSEIGSVKVEQYLTIQKFSHVMHIGSTVSGKLKSDLDAVDAIDAILPAGTLSGAPKLRAMEIIDELENNKRGIYGGAIGYLSFTGNMDTCIAIRLAFTKGNKLFIRSGAGIVADSVPEKEYQECIQKAKAVVNAVQAAEGGIDV